MDNNDLGFIKIPLNTFKSYYEKNTISDNEILQKKVNELIANYNCFISNYDAKSLWEKKKVIAAQKKIVKTSNRTRPYVVLIDINDEMKYKKEFTSFLNKLTDINKIIIYNKIKEFIKNINDDKLHSLFDILINFIKISSNNIYIDILYLFPESYINFHINDYCKSYNSDKKWFVSEEFLIDYKLLYHNDNYDNYCKFVKFKKQSLCLLKALININDKLNKTEFLLTLIDNINMTINIYMIDNNNNNKHIIEFILDEIAIIFDNTKNKAILNNLEKYNLNDFENSTKFKIMKLLERNE